MQGVLWYIGRGLQILGLVWAPYALFLGLNGEDARKELMMLTVAALQFLIGYGLIQLSGVKK